MSISFSVCLSMKILLYGTLPKSTLYSPLVSKTWPSVHMEFNIFQLVLFKFWVRSSQYFCKLFHISLNDDKSFISRDALAQLKFANAAQIRNILVTGSSNIAFLSGIMERLMKIKLTTVNDNGRCLLITPEQIRLSLQKINLASYVT